MSYHQVSINLFALRCNTGMNQLNFWKQVGVTQSAGSRYERGCFVPEPVLMLIDLVYVRGIRLENLEAINVTIGAILREEYNQFYKELGKNLKINSDYENIF